MEPTGEFVPWHRPNRHRNSKYRHGWIVDERGCHIWQGIRGRDGYGRVWDEVNKRVALVHRLRYEREIGPVPEGLVLDHIVCDNGRAGGCCNPLHLNPTTDQANLLRSPRAHANRTHCPKGHPYSGDNLIRTKVGRRCRACDNAASLRQYYEKHDERKAKLAAYREANRDKIRVAANAVRERDREKVNARRRELRRIAKREGRTA